VDSQVAAKADRRTRWARISPQLVSLEVEINFQANVAKTSPDLAPLFRKPKRPAANTKARSKPKTKSMAGLDFKAPVGKEQEDAAVVKHNTRMGVILFVVYVLFYGGFMALSAFWPEVMSNPFFSGVNLAVVYGCALIIAALVLALIYMKICLKAK
jgi:uncharacterized membrane protein (DUF485 family)